MTLFTQLKTSLKINVKHFHRFEDRIIEKRHSISNIPYELNNKENDDVLYSPTTKIPVLYNKNYIREYNSSHNTPHKNIKTKEYIEKNKKRNSVADTSKFEIKNKKLSLMDRFKRILKRNEGDYSPKELNAIFACSPRIDNMMNREKYQKMLSPRN